MLGFRSPSLVITKHSLVCEYLDHWIYLGKPPVLLSPYVYVVSAKVPTNPQETIMAVCCEESFQIGSR